ncbi:MAG TPA: hypothetical protein VM142_00630 [Acidimicrobiales bacterium]|nr:hypothetical protein [Acidimicrobiales bacterium]
MATGMVVVAASGCTRADTPLPPSPPSVALDMSEYRFDHPAVVPRGRVVFRIGNSGKLLHRFLLVPVPPGAPPVATLAKGRLGSLPNTIASSPSYPPGARAGLAVDLRPGRYGLFCIIVDDDRMFHFEKGMASEFRVR